MSQPEIDAAFERWTNVCERGDKSPHFQEFKEMVGVDVPCKVRDGQDFHAEHLREGFLYWLRKRGVAVAE